MARESPASRSPRSRANRASRSDGNARLNRGGRPPVGLGRGLRGQGAARGRRARPDAARQGGQGRRHLPALGRLAGHRRRHRGDQPPARDDADRRTRLAHLRAGAPPLQRARPRLRRDGDRLRRRDRDHVPQPPRLHRDDPRRRQARRQRALPEHDVRRAAAGRGDAAREARRRSSTTRSSPGCSTASTRASRGSSAGPTASPRSRRSTR